MTAEAVERAAARGGVRRRGPRQIVEGVPGPAARHAAERHRAVPSVGAPRRGDHGAQRGRIRRGDLSPPDATARLAGRATRGGPSGPGQPRWPGTSLLGLPGRGQLPGRAAPHLRGPGVELRVPRGGPRATGRLPDHVRGRDAGRRRARRATARSTPSRTGARTAARSSRSTTGARAKHFQCVYHAWSYDLRGNLPRHRVREGHPRPGRHARVLLQGRARAAKAPHHDAGRPRLREPVRRGARPRRLSRRRRSTGASCA